MFAVPSVNFINLDNIVDRNNNHVNFHTNYTLNLDYVLYFYPINISSQ